MLESSVVKSARVLCRLGCFHFSAQIKCLAALAKFHAFCTDESLTQSPAQSSFATVSQTSKQCEQLKPLVTTFVLHNLSGVVSSYCPEQRYGYILRKDKREHLLVCAEHIQHTPPRCAGAEQQQRYLVAGEEVEFSLGIDSDTGDLRVMNVTVIEQTPVFIGYIVRFDTKESVYVHAAGILNALQTSGKHALSARDVVEFDVIQSPTGPQAVNVRADRSILSILERKLKGTVASYSPYKGFGFILRSDTGEKIFVRSFFILKKNPLHVCKSLGVGEAVEFALALDTNKRPMAIHVTGPNDGCVQGDPRVTSPFFIDRLLSHQTQSLFTSENVCGTEVKSYERSKGQTMPLIEQNVTGVVAWYNFQKRYGFITRSDNGRKVFVHVAVISGRSIKSLAVGQRLKFDIALENNRVSAINVTGPDGALLEEQPTVDKDKTADSKKELS